MVDHRSYWATGGAPRGCGAQRTGACRKPGEPYVRARIGSSTASTDMNGGAARGHRGARARPGHPEHFVFSAPDRLARSVPSDRSAPPPRFHFRRILAGLLLRWWRTALWSSFPRRTPPPRDCTDAPMTATASLDGSHFIVFHSMTLSSFRRIRLIRWIRLSRLTSDLSDTPASNRLRAVLRVTLLGSRPSARSPTRSIATRLTLFALPKLAEPEYARTWNSGLPTGMTRSRGAKTGSRRRGDSRADNQRA